MFSSLSLAYFLKMLTANDVCSLVSEELKRITDAALLSRIRELFGCPLSCRARLGLWADWGKIHMRDGAWNAFIEQVVAGQGGQ